MVPGIVEHFADETSTLTDVFVDNSTRNDLLIIIEDDKFARSEACTYLQKVGIQLAGHSSGQ